MILLYITVSISRLCPSSLSCINEYLAINSGGNTGVNSLRPVIAVWLNSSQRSQVGVRMNRSAISDM